MQVMGYYSGTCLSQSPSGQNFLVLIGRWLLLTGGLVYNVSFGELIAVPYREVAVKTGSTVYTSAKVSDLIMP